MICQTIKRKPFGTKEGIIFIDEPFLGYEELFLGSEETFLS
jgi:hypothetical protein